METVQERVKKWWNDYPYTYGLSKKDGGYQDVGALPDEAIDGEFFDEYMRKVRKHMFDAQGPDGRLAERFIPYDWLRGKSVLDIACGMGWSTISMAAAGAHVTGIDISSRVVDIARKHIAYRDLEASANVRVMDAQALEFDDAHFDAVHAYGCLMHMPRTDLAIAEIFRVLKPGGRTFGYMYNKNSPQYWWHIWFLRGVLMGKLIQYKGDTTKLVSRFTDGTRIGGNPHTRLYTPKEIRALFATAGFCDVETQPWGPPNLLDGFPIGPIPLGKLLPYTAKKAISDRIGFGILFRGNKPTASSTVA